MNYKDIFEFFKGLSMMAFDDQKNQSVNDSALSQDAQESKSSGVQDLERCSKEIDELKDAAKRVAADFENFKKRVERDRVMWAQTAQSELLRNLLPIVDDFDRALQQATKQEVQPELKTWLAGFELINKSFYKFLQSYDVTPMTQMTNFDPELHEALAQVESADHESGTIVEVAQKGFMIKDRVLRPARVTVAK